MKKQIGRQQQKQGGNNVPVFKIQVPNFDFHQAENEMRELEENFLKEQEEIRTSRTNKKVLVSLDRNKQDDNRGHVPQTDRTNIKTKTLNHQLPSFRQQQKQFIHLANVIFQNQNQIQASKNQYKYPQTQIHEARAIDSYGYFLQIIEGKSDSTEFQEHGLMCTKALVNYDVWETVSYLNQSVTNQELFNQSRNFPAPQGKSPQFQNKNYSWMDVEVLDYNTNTNKFLVKLLNNNQQKWIGKLSLLFNHEDEKDFQQRLNMAKNLYLNAQDDKRFSQYIQSIDTTQIKPMISSRQESITKKALLKDMSNSNLLKMSQNLMQTVSDDYIMYIKKCIVLKEMKNLEYDQKFQESRIKIRNPFKFIPYFGTINGSISQFEYDFRQFKEQNSYQQTEDSHKNFECSQNQRLKLRKELFVQYQTKLKPTADGPGTFLIQITFETYQNNYYKEQSQALQMQWREYLVSEIQDTLSDTYRFYQTDQKVYQDSELKKLLQRLDLMMNTYVRTTIYKGNILNWTKFIQNFIRPKENEQWLQNSYSLININLIVNPQVGQKKKKDDQKDVFIYYEPPISKVLEAVQLPLHQISEASGSFQIMEKDLVPLVDISKKSAFQFETESAFLENHLDQIKNFIYNAYVEPQRILEQFTQYQFLYERNTKQVFKNLFGESKEKIHINNLSREIIEQEIQEYVTARDEIQQLCISSKNCGFFKVNTQQAKDGLFARTNELIKSVLDKVSDICEDNIETISKNYEDILKKVQIFPNNEKELFELKTTILNHEDSIKNNEKSIKLIENFFNLMEKFCYQQPEQNISNLWNLYYYPQEIKSAVFDGSKANQQQEIKFQDALDFEKEKFAKELVFLKNQFDLIKQFNNYYNVKEYAIETNHLKDQIEKCLDQVKSFNEREALFKQPLSEYHDLSELIKDFEPFNKLWELAIDFDLEKTEWFSGLFQKLVYDKIDKKIEMNLKNSNKIIKHFTELEEKDAINIATELKTDVDAFKKNLWIIELLTTEVMVKKSHLWKQLFDECEIPYTDQVLEEITLKFLVELDLQTKAEQIETVAKKFEKQFSLEKKMNEMVDQLKEIKLIIIPYKNTFVLSSLDEIRQVLDDIFTNLIFMKSSPHIKPSLKKANELEQRLMIVQDTLEGWMKCQRSWMYLEPIFVSDDIRKKMPLEHKKFEGIDRTFRQCMDHFNREPQLWEGIDSDKLKNEFDLNNKTLDAIQKSLSEYLETKRRAFPRFYFLSDDQLLEILAQTKDPTLVQRHVNKCFEAINLLQFLPNEIVGGMISPEKEEVPFTKTIDVNEGERKGNVEKWLLEIEHEMRNTLKNISKTAISDPVKRVEWVLKYPAMVTLMGDMYNWTKNTEEALEKVEKDAGSVNKYLQRLNVELSEIVALVRQDLSELDRMTCGALIVLDVHNRDVIDSLIVAKVHSVFEFDWLSQFRYYCEDDKKNGFRTFCKCINAVQNYGFEYLGNSARLVITPLTDRCFRTLMGAYHLVYGGAPEGPAGTGKTETTKDLAKAVAVQCNVFNCSDQLNFQAMSKYFKGLASSGAWCCFDEFNRIDLEVLSVIAQQVNTIQTAIKEKKKRFEFDGEEIDLIPTCSVNITMNPGYAGRSELPDNLKALFRTVAMMVPNYQLIAEIYLYSVGFSEARDLARKIVASLRLSSEQLSSQFHYDFGMRGLKAILTAAGDAKRQLSYEEDILVLISIMDVNIPKFTQNDIPLFKSITSDLFPGIKLPDREYAHLLNAIQSCCEENNYQAEPEFLAKCIQLYDTIMVRHGLMVVGESTCGKSVIIQQLQQAMTKLHGTFNMTKTNTNKINPKSILSKQLYGLFDKDTKQWTDGVLPRIMRELSANGEIAQREWIIFDGPVDAVWIENMNTVLDDNKKLCLTSGEIIKMTKWMTMMFEVEDLQHASPATVSRCGMVFLEAKNLGWWSILKSYFNVNFPQILEQQKEKIIDLIKHVLDCSFNFIRKYGKFPMQYSQISLQQTFLVIFKYYTQKYNEDEKPDKKIDETLANYVIMSLVWSLGAILEETSREKFHEFVMDLVAGNDVVELYKLDLQYKYTIQPINCKLIETSSIYDICFDNQKNLWINWMNTIAPFKLSEGGKFSELIIPTVDNVRNNHLMTLFISMKKHMLFVGPTGTGKTVNIINEINTNYLNEVFANLVTAFSGQTQCNQIQQQIETKMNIKRRQRRFGPEDRKQRIVIFIDDLNMPAKETYMAQPPIEILRQWMDEGGWYDLESFEFKYLEDITFLAAMGPPSQGRNTISLRYSRHYNTLYVEPFQPTSLQKIFNNVMEWFFINDGKEFSRDIASLRTKVVESTIQIYNKIKSSKELLPIPAKSHYIYNLRDISKVFQGMIKTNHHGCRTDIEFIKLWAHECMRVFQDRLINNDDQEFFQQQLVIIIKEKFNKDWKQIVDIEPLLWTTFVPTVHPNGDTSKRLMTDVYCELNDLENLKKVCNEQLVDFNSMYSGNRMDLVLFMNAIQHILRIVRIITTPNGHALLVGVGGSGRKSLTTLSSHIAQYDMMQVDSKNWVEELQKLLKICGLEQKPVVFQFSDTQVQNENMLEDICNLLNNGEVPNLFPMEEKAKIIEEVSQVMKDGTMNQKYAYFVAQCKENLHLVLCFSPVGESFRRRIRTFPGLVNCTTIDWFLSWPEEALRSTATNSIKQSNIQGKTQEQIQSIKAGLVDICVDMQMRVKDLSANFYTEFRRYYYVTPTSYLELLAIFKRLHSQRTEMVEKQISRYENGLDKLKQTEQQVQIMQIQLEELQPVLEVKTKENTVMLANLQVNQKEASEQKKICEEEERLTNIQRADANEMKESCQNDLARVLPLLDEAARALEKISQNDITQIKSYTTPPSTLDLVMQSVVVAFGEEDKVKWKPKDPSDPSKGKEQDFWAYAKQAILNNKLIGRIQEYREEKIKAMSQKSINRLKHICEMPDFAKEKLVKVSEAAANLASWIRACVETYEALLVVEPKRKSLAEALESLKIAEATLAEKQAALKKVLDLLQQLEDEYNKARKEKEELEAQVNLCAKQLERAEKLISGLGGEKLSWTKKAKEYRESMESITGDVILSSGIISYMGAFMMGYRDLCLNAWQKLLENRDIAYTPKYQLQDVLSDANTIGIWVNNQKLPNDKFSIENAIILKNSSRWPLMIDPQLQANQWIREMVGKTDIRILRQNMPINEILFMLENSISFGYQVLLENIMEEIDPIFESVLQKKIVKQGGQLRIKMGEKYIDYSNDFKFYMTTKLSNPHYPPEVCVKVALLNFMVTPEGLEDQMLNTVVRIEEPNKEEQRQRNIKEFFENKNKQQATENKILKMLSEATGNILDDEDLINTLQQSNLESIEIEEKLKQQEQNRQQFQILQNFYKDSAKRSSNLYFAVIDLAMIEPVYQFSLEFYIDLFEKSIEKAIPGRFERVKNINNMFTQILFQNIVRSLLEKDKLSFSMLIVQRILLEEKKLISPQEVRFLMVGGTALDPKRKNPTDGWLTNKQWANIIELAETIPAFKGLDFHIETNLEGWKNVQLSDEPYMTEEAGWPAEWVKGLNSFQRLLVIRLFRMDKLIPAIQNMIIDQLDKFYVEFPPFDLEAAFKDSTYNKPLIFVLSTGADPRVEVETLASKLNYLSRMNVKSLGQGQGEYAKQAIKDGIENGKWVFLQNCHLAASFMPDLEKIFENIPANCNPDFRMWLTTAPSNVFPVSVLQKGVKLTYEPPKGIKNNLLRSYLSYDKKKFEDCGKPAVWKKLLFGLSFFHATILERRKFGPLGWNIPYEFSATDLIISVLQLNQFLTQYEEIQFPALNYMVAEANYGGRVTDDKDRRLIKVILKDFYCEQVLNEDYKYSPSGVYFCPPEGNFDSYIEYIKSLPLNEKPEVFGMHENAQISAAINESQMQCDTILGLLPRTQGGTGASQEDIIKGKCNEMLQKLPKTFNNDEVAKKWPIIYEECMNTVLQQELIRYNRMINVISTGLDKLHKAIDGLVSMTNDLEDIMISMSNNKVPAAWSKVAYPSLKPLGSWTLDFIKRIKFIQDWIDNGAPVTFWISGFYFTQSFFTGVQQNFARKYRIPIDTLTFDYKCLDEKDPNLDLTLRPENGCYMYGFYLDGARWNYESQRLDEQQPKVLYSEMCQVYFIPMTNQQLEENTEEVLILLQRYICPVYKTSARRGVLTTTGHSSNYVCSLTLPMYDYHNVEHWTKRGVACLTVLDD